MLGRHLLQDGGSRSLMRGIHAFVARRTIVEILGNARAFRLRNGDSGQNHRGCQHDTAKDSSPVVHGPQDYPNRALEDARDLIRPAKMRNESLKTSRLCYASRFET